MKSTADDKTVDHHFKIELTAAETARLTAYLQENGLKKLALMRKAVLHYLDHVGA